MKCLPAPVCVALACLTLTGAPVAGDVVHADDVIVDGNLCVGAGCANGETFSTQPMKLKNSEVRLRFVDISSPPFPGRDWEIEINDLVSGGRDRFSVVDLTSGGTPFSIEGDAWVNTLWVGRYGTVGIGTSMPVDGLHIMRQAPALRLEHTSSNPQTWRLAVDDFGLYVYENGHQVVPLRIVPGPASGVPGDIGIGTQTPEAALHVHRANGTARLLVEETQAANEPRTLLQLRNSGRPELVMSNTATGGEWSFGAGTNFVLKQGTVGSDSAAKAKLFEIRPGGDAVLAGSLITGGTTCGSGCDAVFAPDYDLPGIAAHAEAMFALGHLPNVGPTPEGQPIDLTDKLGRMLNELEHAHIYIARLEREVRRIPELEARLAALEARAGTE